MSARTHRQKEAPPFFTRSGAIEAWHLSFFFILKDFTGCAIPVPIAIVVFVRATSSKAAKFMEVLQTLAREIDPRAASGVGFRATASKSSAII
jgi:hypothetical protein